MVTALFRTVNHAANRKSMGPDPSKEVTEFVHLLTTIPRAHGVTSGIMVTNNGFSKNAKSVAREHPQIELYSVEDLRQNFFPIKDGLNKIIEKYEASSVSTDFIELRGKMQRNSMRQHNVLEVLLNFTREGFGCIGLLGDFGSGKTTLFERLHYSLAKDFLQKKHSKIPIFYRLRERTLSPTFEDFITSSFATNFGFSLHYEKIREKNSQGDFFHIFDGFDEMFHMERASEKIKRTQEIVEFVGLHSAGAISSRPTYFLSPTEYDTQFLETLRSPQKNPMLKAKVAQDNIGMLNKFLERRQLPVVFDKNRRSIEIQSLSDSDISAYLKSNDHRYRKKIGVSWVEILAFLKSIYDLGDLMRRPILLRLISESVLEGLINIDDSARTYNPYQLYNTYTWFSLCREFGKSKEKEIFDPSAREKICQELALAATKEKSFVLTSDRIFEVIERESKNSLEPHEVVNLESAVSELRTSSFLKFSGTESFQFAHRSFLEFFTAQAFCRSLFSGNTGFFEQTRLSPGAVFFAAGYIQSDEKIRKIVDEKLRALPKRSTNLRNLEACSLSAGKSFKGLEIRGKQIEGTVVVGQQVDDFKFIRTLFSKSQFKNSQFRSCEFDVCTLEEVVFEETGFVDCTGSLLFSTSEMYRCTLWDCNISLPGQKTVLKSNKFHRCNLELSETIECSDVLISDCTVSFAVNLQRKKPISILSGRVLKSQLKYQGRKLYGSDLVGVRPSPPYIGLSMMMEIKDTLFSSIFISNAAASATKSSKASVETNMEDNYGLVVIAISNAQDFKKKLELKNPNLLVVCSDDYFRDEESKWVQRTKLKQRLVSMPEIEVRKDACTAILKRFFLEFGEGKEPTEKKSKRDQETGEDDDDDDDDSSHT